MTAPARRRVLPVAPRLAEREQAERTRRRRRRVRRASYVALALVPVCLLSWLLLASPLLSVDRVEVSGTRQVSADAVRTAAGVRTGTPLARVDLDRVRGRVLALGPVARVRVARAWPGTLRLRVTERVAVATARGADGSWRLVDAAGVRYAPSAEPAPGLPTVEDGAPGVAAGVLAALPAALRDQVARVEQPSPSSVVLGLRDGRAVVWGAPGDADEAARKAAVVAALLARPGKVVDVTTPDLAVVR